MIKQNRCQNFNLSSMFVIYQPSLYDHGLYLLIGNLSEKLYRVTEGMLFVRPIACIFKAVSVFSAIEIKNSHYLSVNAFSTKVLIRDIILRLLLETGPPFWVDIRATRRSSRLPGKGRNTFISQ